MKTKGSTCRLPLDLHNRISEEMESTVSRLIEMVIQEYYENGDVRAMEKERTLEFHVIAFQVSEELFQRIEAYLDRYEQENHRRLTQREFVISLIEQGTRPRKVQPKAVNPKKQRLKFPKRCKTAIRNRNRADCPSVPCVGRGTRQGQHDARRTGRKRSRQF